MENLAFPSGFLWGVSTSAFQIEGATSEDGRGPSVWDTFAPGRADVACDHYHRWTEDVALLTELGVGAYRFSFAWPRIQPTGSGAPNAAGLAFYDRLIDALCEADIAPVATVYHWDTPQPLEDDGGWLNREKAYRFAEYASVLGERFADRVRMWIPLNEPMVTTMFGYAIGEYAPGRTLLLDALPTAHHQHLAHGLAVQALRAAGASNIGTANHHCPVWPTSNAEADHDAARRLDALLNRAFSDPVLLGGYPAEIEPHLPAGYADDLVNIAQPLDFYGVNYYEPQGAAAPGEGSPLPFELRPIEGFPRTTNDSPIVPAALHELLVGLRDRYGERLPPVYLTENGASFDGVHDQERIDFLDAHLRSVAAAITAGVEVRGYFVWSLLDNFEWSKGYAPRFGLVHVDYETQRRTPKDSFHWYRKLVRA
ncbi:GH1 family beta-glucosidase [Amycolatopsis methanolica]|uniref:GH1 family beta-glucosidase n=1 Tax=Amycolatopsis methanolica TaxID=1814 RepID=UPI00342491BF